jgi:hypothetical protein
MASVLSFSRAEVVERDPFDHSNEAAPICYQLATTNPEMRKRRDAGIATMLSSQSGVGASLLSYDSDIRGIRSISARRALFE